MHSTYKHRHTETLLIFTIFVPFKDYRSIHVISKHVPWLRNLCFIFIAWFFANFTLGLLIKVLLKKSVAYFLKKIHQKYSRNFSKEFLRPYNVCRQFHPSDNYHHHVKAHSQPSRHLRWSFVACVANLTLLHCLCYWFGFNSQYKRHGDISFEITTLQVLINYEKSFNVAIRNLLTKQQEVMKLFISNWLLNTK